jgi:WD40 repeat protein
MNLVERRKTRAGHINRCELRRVNAGAAAVQSLSMSRVVQAAEFFVVGGPVQSDRFCYVERSADSTLLGAIRTRDCCCVLGAPGIGKTSLLQRAARALRASGELAAVVELAQVASRADDMDADRWSFAIAHRILVELQLRVDLAVWWRERTALERESRLADFFWQIVLTNTTAPVAILVDDVERALALPFGDELLSAISLCQARRAHEPDYSRLCFVLAGVASPRQISAQGALELAHFVEVGDFTPEQAYRLAIGFGGESTQTHALMDRVCVWTGGHPYLTQKVARGVSRKGGKLEDVERVVHEQLLSPSALQDEPLARMHATLTERRPGARRALRQLRRIAKAGAISPPADDDARDVLLLSGVVALDPDGKLRYRNRIVREVFGKRWIKRAVPLGWRAWAMAAALAVLVVLAAFAYLNYAPQPFERVLTSADADPAAVEDAYRSLRRLPGFEERADRLLADALRRRSSGTTNVTELQSADTQLRALQGQEAVADRLLADFWLRKMLAAANAEQRDAALLFALRAASESASPSVARGWVRALVDEDYLGLERTFDLSSPPRTWAVDWPSGTLVWIGAEPVARRAALRAGGVDAPSVLRLSALQHVALERDLAVESEGSAGAFELSVAIAHPASAEVTLTLTAPSGSSATVTLPQSGGAENFVLAAQQGTPFADLADEERRGMWRLRLVDRRVENVGSLAGWGLRFGEDNWRDDPEESVEIPDPQRTETVTVQPSSNGAYAIVQPETAGATGSIALWNLAAGRLQGDFTAIARPSSVAVNGAGTRLVAAGKSFTTIWNVSDGTTVARLETQTEFILPPVFSPDGGYIAIAERVEGSPPLYSVLRSDDGSLVSSVGGMEGIERWWFGPGGRYFALLTANGAVHVVDARRGGERARLAHPSGVAALLPRGDSVITVDGAGEIRDWPLEAPTRDAAGRRLGRTTAPEAVSLSSDGSALAYAAGAGEFVVRDVRSGARSQTVRMHTEGSERVLLSPDGVRLVTSSGQRFRVWSVRGGGERSATAELETAALAVDRSSNVVATGLRGGQLHIGDSVAPDPVSDAALDYIGHRGAISVVVASAANRIVASGGTDGVVRLWDIATGEPAGPVLPHAVGRGEGPITALALSYDGDSIASAAPSSARVWSVSDGTGSLEIELTSPATALAFAPSSAALAIAQTDGTLRIVDLGGGAERTITGGGLLTSVAYAPGRAYLATANEQGTVQLRTVSGETIGATHTLPSAVRWIGFGADEWLFAATDRWLHAYATSPAGVELVRSRPISLSSSASRAYAALGAERALVAGFDARGSLRRVEVDLSETRAPSSDTAPELLERDWTTALGQRLDDSGEPVAGDR